MAGNFTFGFAVETEVAGARALFADIAAGVSVLSFCGVGGLVELFFLSFSKYYMNCGTNVSSSFNFMVPAYFIVP